MERGRIKGFYSRATKTFFGIAVGLLFLLGLQPAQALALEIADKETVASYASSLLSGMIRTENYQELFGIDLSDSALLLGEPIVGVEETAGVQTDTGIRYWPVFQDGEPCCLIATITDDEGETVFRLTVFDLQKLDRALREQSACYVELEDGMERLVVADYSCGGRQSLKAFQEEWLNDGDPSKFLPICLDLEEPLSQQDGAEGWHGSESNVDGYSARASASTRAATLSPQLKVPLRNQGSTNLCWANCVSSIGAYLTGQNLPAVDICRTIKGQENVGGTEADAVAALRLFTYPSVTTRIGSLPVTSVVSDSDIKRWINNGVPIYARLVNGSSGHAVVVCGWYANSSGVMSVYVMNSGHGRYELMSKSSLGIFSLTYNSASFSWNRGSVLLTGWQKPYGGERWSYFLSSGAKKTGWLKDGGYWYYLDGSGYMLASKWVKVDGHWYYLDQYGMMKTGWVKVQGYWYYLDSSGAMKTGWVKVGNYWYYLRPSANVPAAGPEGAMLASGSWTIDGKPYRFDSSGVCLNP